MKIIRDAATLLILALLVMSVRVTPLDHVGDLLPSAEASETAQASMIPRLTTAEVDARPVAGAEADPETACPVRTRALHCTTGEDGVNHCVLELQRVETLVLPAANTEALRVVSRSCT